MEKKEKLPELAAQIENCTRCDLFKSANHAVPGEGSPTAEIAFIGEAPGFHEDAKGRPFVGNAGKYLDLLLSKVGLIRGEVFITNVVKHRPPQNRDPAPNEISACNGWLDAQVSIISPKIIVTLGKWSLNRYLPQKKISEVHGKLFQIQDVVVIPMYHPAAALRNGKIGKELEDDFMKNKQFMKNPQLAGQTAQPLEESGQGSLF